MSAIRSKTLAIVFVASLLGSPLANSFAHAIAIQATQTAAPAKPARVVGAIKTINGNTITLTPDSGPEVQVNVQAGARIRRIAPGEKDPKNAIAIQLQDLQVGDRILILAKPSDDGKTMNAIDVLAMKVADIAAKRAQEQQDWQKRGIDGLVKSVDAAAGTVTILVSSLGASKSITVHAPATTVIRRYAPDSVKFDDAKPSSLAEVHAGDQLRARGDRSADGSELAAEEIVTGLFRNLAGTINSVDASANTLNVLDLQTKKSLTVKITSDSQLHKLPPEVAQRFAMRLKGGSGAGAGTGAAGANGTSGAGANASASGGPPANGNGANGGNGPGAYGSMRQGGRSGAPDLNQIISHQPAVALTDLHKGDAVVLLTTEGSASVNPTAIMLVSGVEPILQASPGASSALMLTPWTLGAPAGDAGSQ